MRRSLASTTQFQKMAFDGLTNLELPRLNNFDLISEIATLGFVTGNEAGKNALEVLGGAKILYEIYQRVNEEDNKLAMLRAQTILRIADHVKKNPGSSDDQMAKAVQKEIERFAKEAQMIIGS